MGVVYWIVLWILMMVAFGLAWAFIVKGCEAMDAHHAGSEERAANNSADQTQRES